MPPLISLDDDTCIDPALVGVKAANLAKARRAGLPVLPGVVVPIEIGRTAIDHGLEVLRAEGPGKARLAVDRAVLSDELAAVMWAAGASLGDNLILRSSTTLDDDDRFSGAFASIADVRPDEVASAVRGCWSSLFSASTLARFDGAGVSVGDVGVAVLMQRMLDPELGGTAELVDDGTVAVAAVTGQPGPLLAGAVSGIHGKLTEFVDVPRPLAELGLTQPLGRALVTSVHGASLVGCRRIEWAIDAGRLWTLQLDSIATPVPASGTANTHSTTPHGLLRGTPASPGEALGRLLFLESTEDRPSDIEGRILVVPQALAAFAPLLYRAAGLIALEGSVGAHLFTVARSLHVPAIVGLADLHRSTLYADRSEVLVNGDLGTISLIDR